jgi:hypothetical protein
VNNHQLADEEPSRQPIESRSDPKIEELAKYHFGDFSIPSEPGSLFHLIYMFNNKRVT